MGLPTVRTVLYTTCILQAIATVERQIFDFLGYLWLPILFNFLQLIFLIFCFFGVHQRRPGYVVAYAAWALLWIGWNAFVVCAYLDVGGLDKSVDYFSFGTRSFSWWLANGYGCRPEYYVNVSGSEFTEGSGYYPPRPSHVNGCAIDYNYVEVLHSGLQMMLAGISLIAAVCFLHLVRPRCFGKGKSGHNKSIYSIEYSPQVNSGSSGSSTHRSLNHQETTLYANEDNRHAQGNMTPRRVKRRSHGRNSTRSATHQPNKAFGSRNRRASTRSLNMPSNRNAKSLNPVTRMIDDQPAHFRGGAGALDSSTSDEYKHSEPAYGQINPAYESSRPNSIYSSSVNGGGGRSMNPMGNESSPSRPPSALTSYSNFHGQRKALNPLGQIHLTQSAITQQPASLPAISTNPNGGGAAARDPNTSYDDLPPPPMPLTATNGEAVPGAQAHAHAQPQAPPQGRSLGSEQYPVPQQRSSLRRNEYVNMPITNSSGNLLIDPPASSLPPPPEGGAESDPPPSYANTDPLPPPLPSHGSSSGHGNYSNAYEDSNNTQTLRANDRLLPPKPGSTAHAQSNGGPPRHPLGGHHLSAAAAASHRNPGSSHQPPLPSRNHGQNGHVPGQPTRLYGSNTSGTEDEYGFSQGARPQLNGHVSGNPVGGAEGGDKWYLKDSMKPVGAAFHGGNCKCYRCQRKLTAI